MSADEEREKRQRGHKSIIDDSWLRAREQILQAEASEVDPGRALWPVTPSRAEHLRYQRALGAHTATIQFRDDVYAYRAKGGPFDVEELWNAEIGTVQVNGQRVTISLDSLNDWANKRTAVEHETLDPVQGKVSQQKRYRVLLPITTCRDVYRQMQDVLQELGMTAPTEDRTPTDSPSGENLAALVKARGQETAYESLPDRFKEGLEVDE